MLTTHPVPQTNILELTVTAPLEAEDFEELGPVLERLGQEYDKLNLLLNVESIGTLGPAALWQDMKLAPHLGSFNRVAVISQVDWYGALADKADVLLPGITMKRFEVGEHDAALAWLRGDSAA